MRFALTLGLVFLLTPLVAEAAAPDAHAIARRLGRGMNLGNALEAPSEGAWGVTLKEEFFPTIRRAGFQTVRLPVRFAAHAGESAPYAMDQAFLERVDWAVDQALKNDLLVIVDQHHYDAMDKHPTEALPRLKGLWKQIAEHYRDRPETVLFELHNEPHEGLTDEVWNAAIPEVLAVVRQSNPGRAVIVGPSSWNDLNHLEALRLPEADRGLIATFHDYRPFEFTHQGAEWVDGASKWKGRTWTATPEQVAALRGDFARAASWAKSHDRPLFLGEFGAYSGADQESRVRWTAAMAREAERLEISWSYWEFCAGFGAYDLQAGAWRRPLLDALVPPTR